MLAHACASMNVHTLRERGRERRGGGAGEEEEEETHHSH